MSEVETAPRPETTRTRRGLFGTDSAGLGRSAAIAAAALGGGALAAGSARAATSGYNDVDIFNFALNFEFLGAQYYLGALGTSFSGVGGKTSGNVGTPGAVTYPDGASYPTAVPFNSQILMDFCVQLAVDEYAHATFLQDVLGSMAIAQPQIDFAAYTPLAVAAGVIQQGQTFNPYADEISFLLGAYVLEDVCVTALTGAAGLVVDRTLLAYAAGYLGTESQQAGAIRGFLAQFGMNKATDKISALRVKLSGIGDNGTGDQNNNYNISNGDQQAQAFRRTPPQVLSIAYASQAGTPVASGGFFPAGVNGTFAGFMMSA